MEVYIDDKIAKSVKEVDHVRDWRRHSRYSDTIARNLT